jgi:2-methylisocitrate lyase-like PEP mutase family enzyme
MRKASDRRGAFRALRENGCFVIPNPWDVGSARALARLGFVALARRAPASLAACPIPRHSLAVDAVLDHVAEIVAATELPVSADTSRRLGSALARVAWGAFLRPAEEIAAGGSFAGLDGASPFAELNGMFAAADASRPRG